MPSGARMMEQGVVLRRRPKRFVGFGDDDAHDDLATRLDAIAARGCGSRRVVGVARRRLGAHLARWLIFAQAFERAFPDIAIAGPAGDLDLGDQLRLDPSPVRLAPRRAPAAKRTSFRFERS